MPRPDARSVTAAVRAEEATPLDDLLFGAAPAVRPRRRPAPSVAPIPPRPDVGTPGPVVDPGTVEPASFAPAVEVATEDQEPPAADLQAAPAVAPRAERRASPTPRRASMSVPVGTEVPAAPTYGRSRYFQLTVPLPLETHAALRDAAVARGSIREMSIIVREAIEAYLGRLEGMGEAERQATLAAATDALTAARARGRRDVAYRLKEEQRARLLPFSGAQGIPMSAIAAAAISAALTPTG